MNKFLTGEALDTTICDIIWEAEKTLLIVSPYIKLDDYFKKLFDRHENNPKMHLILVFGKNEGSVHKSMSRKDFEYFKKFLNVSIIYAPNLHAKYYGNEKQGVVTSINLYDYSFKHNLEFGVHAKQSLFDRIAASTDNDAWNECMRIASTHDAIFIKRPVYENKKVVFSATKNYVKSNILHDLTEDIFKLYNNRISINKKLPDFSAELELGSLATEKPKRQETSQNQQKFKKMGFCIRSGKQIEYNPNRPMSIEAWKVWNQYGNPDFPEAFCHRTGRKSYGKTSMRRPELP